MSWPSRYRGVAAALGAALLFGASTPLAKALLREMGPWMLAGLFYLGAGLGLALWRIARRAEPVRPRRGEAAWLAGAVLAGGVVAPVLLLFGLRHMPASGASLLLNAEGVFTALLAWFAFRESVNRRIALGMLCIVAGATLLAWPDEARFAGFWPALAILGACLAWGLDNNLTRQVSLSDAAWIASVKGMVAGSVNLVLARVAGDAWPAPSLMAVAAAVGFVAYGISLALFVVGLRHLGTARTGAYFSIAPFFGALLAVAMGEPLTPPLAAAGLLMALGVWLHLTESHAHEHHHGVLEHSHEHVHDEHHAHDHGGRAPPPEGRHAHWHRHEAMTHTHPHFPDMHHLHEH